MKREPGPLTNVLRPVLDTYRDAAVAVVGCHAAGIERESCELDVIVITNEAQARKSFKFRETCCDIYFLSEKEALRPSDPEVAMSLAQAKTVRDASLILSTSVAANQAVIEENARRSSQQRLTSCLKALSRTDESLSVNEIRDANYWLLSASYDFAHSWLYALEVVPSPSHLLKQLKEHSKGNARNFEAFSQGAGLERSSRRGCAVRLEGLSVLYDLMDSRQAEEYDTGPSTSETSFHIVKRKAEQLADQMEHAESYSFLGNEVTKLLLSVLRTQHQGTGPGVRSQTMVDLLPNEKQSLLSDRLISDLGIVRPKPIVREALLVMKDRVADMARTI